MIGNGRRARWEDALDVLVHLHDQIRSERLPVMDFDGKVGTFRQLLHSRGPAQQAAYALRSAVKRAEPVFVSPDVFAAWRFASPAFRAEPIRADERLTQAALVLLPESVELAPGAELLYPAVRALLWASAIGSDGGPLIAVAGFAELQARWTLVGQTLLPIDTEPESAVEPNIAERQRRVFGDDGTATMLSVWREVQSFWRLAQQVVQAPERASRPGRRAAKRANLDSEHVTVIRLRRQRHELPEAERDVDWTCRWVVRGHWRRLPDGRQTYVRPHVKGPEDKPLRVTERVWEFVR